MKASANCYAVIEHFEDCVLHSYPDPKTGGDPWTAMWGATGPDIRPGMVFTQTQADARLLLDVATKGEFYVDRAVLVTVTQGIYDACCSAWFNIGPGSPTKDGLSRLKSGQPSTFLRKLDAGDFAGARAELGKWVSPGTPVEHGLRRRRLAEQCLWDGQTGAEAIATANAL